MGEELIELEFLMDLSELHKRFWIWHFKHPWAELEDWPGWFIKGGLFTSICNWSFACEAAERRREAAVRQCPAKLREMRCFHCPLWPKSGLESDCIYDSDNLHGQWADITLLSQTNDRRLLAHQIAELPWHGERIYPVLISKEAIPAAILKSLGNGFVELSDIE